MSPILTVVLVLVAAAVAGALGFYLGGENRKRTAEAKIGSAEEEAKRIVNDAIIFLLLKFLNVIKSLTVSPETIIFLQLIQLIFMKSVPI